MAKRVTLGGQRLGAGKQMQISMHNYERSTHNLKESFKSSVACGTLVPFYCNVGLNGDTFTIDLNAMVRTIPTNGPLFGSFKLQLDMFQIPIRLYQGLLHNNPLNIGMNMAQVRLPKIQLAYKAFKGKPWDKSQEFSQCASNSLAKYLGVSGIGVKDATWIGNQTDKVMFRDFNAVPFLGYYDIFKNYYANKQETNAYVITGKYKQEPITIKMVKYSDVEYTSYREFTYNKSTNEWQTPINLHKDWYIKIQGDNLNSEYLEFDGFSLRDPNSYKIINESRDEIKVQIKNTIDSGASIKILGNSINSQIELQPFALENIDKMRYDILKNMGFSETFTIGDEMHNPKTQGHYLPYSVLTGYVEQTGESKNAASQNGLVVKTYQSDLFNNWINTDWITGQNGIAAVTAVDTSEGNFKLDVLNLMQKVYNQLNRVAAAGGSFEDWQEATYGEDAIRRAETPIYMGGMSSEVVFEEVISTADTTAENKLGTLGGKGTLAGKKAGHIEIKPKEPVIIMGIMSITPRLDYTQGNAWYMTELDSMEDLHKPALDGIGYQELMCEQMAWWTTTTQAANFGDMRRTSAGKVPAWINYMTAIDKAYSTFAEQNNQGYMILARNYEPHINQDGTIDIEDLTTYIDPRKFNAAFADTNLDAQNFWVQIVTDVVARRKMSAKIIPNL